MSDIAQNRMLPVRPVGHKASGWWGMVMLVATEAALFIYLLFSYFYLGLQHVGPWPVAGPPSLLLALPNTFVLLLSSGFAWWGQRGIEQGRGHQLRQGLLAAFLLGTAFMTIQGLEWHNKVFTPSANSYASLYLTVTGIHMMHVAIGIIILGALFVWSVMNRFTARRHIHVTLGIIYWHFVDAVWLAVFTTFYLTPRLGFP
jgi:heme/copper-type cytochrome/quinol oxidase subunit 3